MVKSTNILSVIGTILIAIIGISLLGGMDNSPKKYNYSHSY